MQEDTKHNEALVTQSFMKFMNDNEFKQIEPDTLLSSTFKTTFTVSGGPNFTEKYLSENNNSLAKNTAVIQRCFRHWDIENVGDKKHLSFFHMLVTNSFDGYSRKDIFKFHYLYLTKVLKLEKEKIYCTVFKGGIVFGQKFPKDEEAIQILNALGFKEQQIILLDGSANFVANTVEPVGGPRVELFYKRDKEGLCDNCIAGLCECGKYTEFWTHVLYNIYVDFDKETERYTFTPLNRRNYAAGFGLERLLVLLDNKEDILETNNINEIVSIITKKLIADNVYNEEFKDDIKIISEYLRGLIFLSFDGAENLNNRKYRGKVYIYRKFSREIFILLDKINLRSNSSLIFLINEIIDLYKLTNSELYLEKEVIINYIKKGKKRYLNNK